MTSPGEEAIRKVNAGAEEVLVALRENEGNRENQLAILRGVMLGAAVAPLEVVLKEVQEMVDQLYASIGKSGG